MIKLVYPKLIKTPRQKYIHGYSALERLRRKFNTRAGNLSDRARKFRKECLRVQEMIAINTLLFKDKLNIAPVDENNVSGNEQGMLRKMGKNNYGRVNLTKLTKVDLDKVAGVAPLPPDPIEDFTTWTEVDPFGHIIVTSTKVQIDDMSENEDTYVYIDKGAGHFGNAFEHDLEATARNTAPESATVQLLFWALSNTLDDSYYWTINYLEGVSIFAWGDMEWFLWDYEDRDYDDTDIHMAQDTKFYLTITRNGTLFTLNIYDDANRTNLVDTLILTIGAGRSYRYLYAACSYSHFRPQYLAYGDIENYDLKESEIDQSSVNYYA